MLRLIKLLAFSYLLVGCQSRAVVPVAATDSVAVKRTSEMTAQCLLTYKEVPGLLSARQKCLNQASQTLLPYYNSNVVNVANACAEKLLKLAEAADNNSITLNAYSQAKQSLQGQCESAAKEGLGESASRISSVASVPQPDYRGYQPSNQVATGASTSNTSLAPSSADTQMEKAKSDCRQLYKTGTKKYGDCVMKLLD